MDRSLIDNYKYYHSAGLYGTGGSHFPFVLHHVMALAPRSIIDYGAGHSDIAWRLGRKVRAQKVARFDPAIPELATLPGEVFELVVNFDVLEHIPEEELDAVLAEMAGTAHQALMVIDTVPARKILADGRNAHVSLHDEQWWQERLQRYFPGIKAFAIGSPHRAAFKTWDQGLAPWRRDAIELKERVAFSFRKRIGKIRKHYARRAAARDGRQGKPQP